MNASIVAFAATLAAYRGKLGNDDTDYQLRVGIARTLKELEALQLRVMRRDREKAKLPASKK